MRGSRKRPQITFLLPIVVVRALQPSPANDARQLGGNLLLLKKFLQLLGSLRVGWPESVSKTAKSLRLAHLQGVRRNKCSGL